MSWLALGAELIVGAVMIAGGIAVTWFARGGKPTALGLSVVPVSALTLIVIGGAMILNSLRII
jgi:hypothetical protein